MKKSLLLGLVVGILAVVGYSTWLGFKKNSPEKDFFSQEKIYADIFNVLPAGEDVRDKQEIVITFDKEVVPLGEMLRESIAIDIQPALACKWRWINRSSLACTLNRDEKLKLATNYTISIPKQFSSEDNIELNQPYRFEFSTVRPRVQTNYIILWETPTKPYIELSFSMPVTKESVLNAFKMVDTESDVMHEIELMDRIVTEDETSTRVEYAIDTSKASTAKQEWIITSKALLDADRNFRLTLVNSLYSTEGPLPSTQEYNYYFRTYGAFHFLGVRCQIESGERMLLRVDSLESELFSKKNECDPLGSISLVFSTPVSRKSVADFVKFNPKLNYLAESFDPWEGSQDDDYYDYEHEEYKEYAVWLPTIIKANAKHTVTIDTKKMQDMFGRTLQGDNEISFKTAHRKPNLTLGYYNIVLEKGVDSDAALYATNLKNIDLDFIRFDAKNIVNKQRNTHAIPIMDIEDVAYKTKMDIRKALGGKSGVLYGRVTSDSLRYPAGSVLAQVTPFQVHAKFGHFNTFIWVSTFADAKPVKDAKVTVYYGKTDEIDKLHKLSSTTLTDTQGRVTLEGRVALQEMANKVYKKEYANKFFIHVEQGEDEALLALDYGYEIYNYSVYSYPRAIGEHAKVWGTTPQGVYKLGDSVAYKIYHRDQNNTKLITANQDEKFNLRVYDPLDTLVHENVNISLNTFGALDGSFVVPKQGASGYYRFELESKKTNYIWHPMSILVSDFTPAPFRVETQFNKALYIPGEEIQISSHAMMFSGGAYAHAPVRINAYIKEEQFRTNDPELKGFYFLNSQYEEKTLVDVRENLDAKGEHAYTLKLEEMNIPYGSITLEASVQDERGKFVSAYASANYAQRDRFVGLKNKKWVYEQSKPSAIEVVVLDQDKKMLKGIKVDVEIEYKEYRSARVKGAGNAFVTVNSAHWVQESTCSIVSALEAKECVFTPQNMGSYRFRATVQDTQKKLSTTEIYGWVRGSGTIVWEQSNDATLEIIPESDTYKIGDTARYLVKNPFETTEALITIERYGVLDSWVQTFDTSTPIVEFTVKEEYLPGFYLSVVALSPRVAKPIKNDIVDLGKPSYKMGYVQTFVKDPKKELSVTIHSDKEVYKPRDKVTLTIDVKNNLHSKKENYELAIAVVDSSVLALNSEGGYYYDLYKGLNNLEPLDVQNFSLISRLIGRQNFEKKGANPGGDGGSDGLGIKSFRDDIKYIAYWNPSLEVNASKSTNVEFTLPDNLTEFKVIALAITKDDMMGHGMYPFKVNKETQLRPIMPNQVLSGDSFEAGFSIYNSTKEKRKLKISMQAKGAAEGKKDITLQLEPFGREKVFMPLKTTSDGNVTLHIHAGDTLDSDGLEHVLVVNKRTSLMTMANFGSTTESVVNEAIKVPKNIYPNVGSIGVVLSSTVLGNIDGAFTYLKEYPYWCWEQRLSKGLGASYYLSLQEYLNDELKWEGADSIVKKMLEDASAYQAPNGGMAFWVGANEYVNPYISAYSALGFEWLKESGYEVDAVVEEKLHGYLENFLTQQNALHGYNTGMNATIRAVALHALARGKKLDASDIERYFKHYKSMSLFGRAHYFQAMLHTKNVSQHQKDALLDSILATATQSAGRFDFTENLENEYVHLLESPMRSNCAVLSALMEAKKVGGFEKKIGDIPPKVVRSITQHRGTKNHWENTQENLFCMQAIKEYAQVYENEAVAMDVNVLLDKKELAKVAFQSKTDAQKQIEKTITKEDIGTDKTLTIQKEGTGRLYYMSRISYAPTDVGAQPVNAGFEIHREYAKKEKDGWKLLVPPYKIQKGDVIRIDLYISVTAGKYYVVLTDPIAGGVEPINTALATASISDADTTSAKMAKGSRWYDLAEWNDYGWYDSGFYHTELRHDSAQFYSDYLGAGNYHLSYTVQAIASGEFSAMPSHIEQMYEPDVFGKSIPATFVVE